MISYKYREKISHIRICLDEFRENVRKNGKSLDYFCENIGEHEKRVNLAHYLPFFVRRICFKAVRL